MERVLLVRHGESEYSVRGATNGDASVAVGLTETGREQARRLGELVAAERLELCATSGMPRAAETAALALADRQVPRLVLVALNDIRVGSFEGGPLVDYLAWARSHGPEDPAPGGGETRVEALRRYLGAYRELLARPERVALVVAHGLPIRYVLNAAAGIEPRQVLDQVPYAEPFALTAAELAAALDLLAAWARAPAWR
jgi:probable phosphoglycerate mutase